MVECQIGMGDFREQSLGFGGQNRQTDKPQGLFWFDATYTTYTQGKQAFHTLSAGSNKSGKDC